MILKAQHNDLIVGMAPDLIDKDIVVLQYADDMTLCVSHDPDKVINLNLM